MILKAGLVASLLLCAPLLVQAQVYPPPDGELKTEYDRFTGKQRVSLFQLQVAEKEYDFDYQRLYLSAVTEYVSGTSPQAPQNVAVMFTSWSLFNNRYTETATLDSILDGKRKSFGDFVPTQRTIVNGKYVVLLMGLIKYSEFESLVKADKAELRLGNVEFTITDSMKKRLQLFTSFVHP